MKTFRLDLAYRGTQFHGWQYQPGMRTVEGCLRQAIEQMGFQEYQTRGASRTDAGVHALSQIVRLDLETHLQAEDLRRGLQSLTPADMRVNSAVPEQANFRPSLDAVCKRYVYRLLPQIVLGGVRAPIFATDYAWWVRYPLCMDTMNEAAQQLIGRHNFEGFRNSSKDETDVSTRTMFDMAWTELDHCWIFEIVGDGFLYRMVRNIVGSLIEVGRGLEPPEHLGHILKSKDRSLGGVAAPPQGLFLAEFSYQKGERLELQRRDLDLF